MCERDGGVVQLTVMLWHDGDQHLPCRTCLACRKEQGQGTQARARQGVGSATRRAEQSRIQRKTRTGSSTFGCRARAAKMEVPRPPAAPTPCFHTLSCPRLYARARAPVRSGLR